MSLQTDAEECLLAAIAARNGVDVPPEKMGDVKPSDGEIGAQTGLAWRVTLEDAAARLRSLHYPTGKPTLDKANTLLNKVLLESQAYLEKLSKPQSAMTKVMFWGGTGAAIGALAAAIRQFVKRR